MWWVHGWASGQAEKYPIAQSWIFLKPKSGGINPSLSISVPTPHKSQLIQRFASVSAVERSDSVIELSGQQ
jgi:hypothetical protein